MPNSSRNSSCFAWKLNFSQTRILAGDVSDIFERAGCLNQIGGESGRKWDGQSGLKIGVDQPMGGGSDPGKLALRVCGFTGYLCQQGVSGRVKRVSRQGVSGGGLLRREIVCCSTCLLFADALLHNVSATLGY